MNVISAKKSTLPRFVAHLQLDIDPAAERCALLDRRSAERLLVAKRGSGNWSLILPVEFATSQNLLVLMFDDTRQYNAVVVDHVQLPLVDANLITVSR